MRSTWHYLILSFLCAPVHTASAQPEPPAQASGEQKLDEDSPAQQTPGEQPDHQANAEHRPPRSPAPRESVNAPRPAHSEPTPTPRARPESLPSASPPVEVSVTYRADAARRLRRSSAAVQVVDVDSVRGEGAELGAVLSRQEGLNVRQSGGLGAQGRISVQGMGADQIRFFVDGLPLELSGYPDNVANVPVDVVSRVDVYRGVVPGRFGADALGGAIDLVSHELVPGPHAHASYQLGAYDSHRASLRLQALSERTGWFARARGFLDSARNDYPIDVEGFDASGRSIAQRAYRFHDAYSGGYGDLEVGVVGRPYAERLSLRGFGSSFDKELNHNVIMTTPYGEVLTMRRAQGAVLRYQVDFGERVSLEATLGYSHRKNGLRDVGTCAYDWLGQCTRELPEGGEIGAGPTNLRIQEHAAYARAQLAAHASRLLQFRLSMSPTLVSRSARDLVPGAQRPAGERDLFSVSIALEHELDALAGRLENVLFVREYLLLVRAEQRVVSGDLLPVDRDLQRAGAGDALRLRLHDTLIAKASYELTTRMPSADELFGDGMLVLANLELRPERSHNANLQLLVELPDTRAGSFTGSAGGFLRMADDLIVLLADAQSLAYDNVLAARGFGAEAALRYASLRDYLTLDANVTWQDLRNRSRRGPFAMSEGDRIPNRPYLFANWSIRLQLPDSWTQGDALSLTFRQSYVHAYFRSWESLGDVEGKERIPSQLVSSAVIGYALAAGARELLTSFEVHNLTDASVYDFYGVQRPGRWALAKLSLSI